MADRQPDLVMIAGPNGSGKSTLVAALRAAPEIDFPALYINADDIQKTEGLGARTAQGEAQRRRALAVASGASVAFETVMSHPSHLALLQQAREQGYRVIAHLVSLDAPERNVERVALRVQEGGHDVPEENTRALSQNGRSISVGNQSGARNLCVRQLIKRTTATTRSRVGR